VMPARAMTPKDVGDVLRKPRSSPPRGSCSRGRAPRFPLVSSRTRWSGRGPAFAPACGRGGDRRRGRSCRGCPSWRPGCRRGRRSTAPCLLARGRVGPPPGRARGRAGRPGRRHGWLPCLGRARGTLFLRSRAPPPSPRCGRRRRAGVRRARRRGGRGFAGGPLPRRPVITWRLAKAKLAAACMAERYSRPSPLETGAQASFGSGRAL
jgi:hypothetical protein